MHSGAGTLALTGALCAALTSDPQAQPQRVQPPPPPPPLLLGTPSQGKLRAGESNRYRFEVQPGEFVSLTVEQLGIDVAISLLDTDGKERMTLNAMDDEFRPERVVTIADTGGSVIVKVQGASAAAAGQ